MGLRRTAVSLRAKLGKSESLQVIVFNEEGLT